MSKNLLKPTNTNPPVKRLSVLIPVYNSERTIAPLAEHCIQILQPHFDTLEIILVNDGSADNSHAAALSLSTRYPDIIKYIRLAKNFGEHNAVMCGLGFVTGDCVAIIDDDFQNPPAEILKLVNELRKGYDAVYSYYTEKKHGLFRNLGSVFNDIFATFLLRKPRGFYLSSFKVLNAFLIQTVVQYKGPFPYLDGIIWRSTTAISRVLCQNDERKDGQSQYTFTRLVHLWLNMFTGFSIVPLRVASFIGILMSITGFLLALFFVISRITGSIFLHQKIPAGWASLIVCLTFFSGLQLCVLGLIGEYLGRLFLTVNHAPQFVIRDTYGTKSNG